MTTTFYAQHEGQLRPLDELVWIVSASCGCSYAASIPRSGVMTEQEALRSVSDGAREYNRAVKLGHTARLHLLDDFRSGAAMLSAVCLHKPKWGGDW